MIESEWTKGLLGVLVSGNGVAGTDPVHANEIVASTGTSIAYDETTRVATLTSAASGSTGATGAGYGGTSATSTLIELGAKTFVTQAGLAYQAGSRVRLTSRADTNNFVEGTVSSYSSTSMAVTIDSYGGQGTFADWNISITGPLGASGSTWFAEVDGATGMRVGDFGLHTFGPGGSWVYRYDGVTNDGFAGWEQIVNISGMTGATGASGPTGATGPGYLATSATSRAINYGAIGFTTQAGLALALGMRVRASSRADVFRYMEGVIVEYSGTTLTVYVDTVGSSGTFADWNIVAAGNPGVSGAGMGTLGPIGYSSGATGSTAAGWVSCSPLDTIHTTAGDRPLMAIPVPRSGTLTGWTVSHGAAISGAIVYDLYINNVDTTSTITMSTMTQWGAVSGLSIAVTQGDLLNVYVDPGSSAYAKINFEFTWSA